MERFIPWVNFLPLALFAWGPRLVGITKTGEICPYAFYLATAVAAVQILYTWHSGLPIDFLALGANIFLICGSVGYAFHSLHLFPYFLAKKPGIFFFIFFYGVILSIIRPEGFLQLPERLSPYRLIGSLGLLGLTVLALGLCFFLASYLNFGWSLGVGIPFVGLLTAREFFYKFLEQKSLNT